MKVIEGRIISSRLAQFGATGVEYGTIAVRTTEGSSLNVKVDAYTMREEFATGDYVRIDLEELGKTGIWVARKITRIDSQDMTVRPEPTEISSSS